MNLLGKLSKLWDKKSPEEKFNEIFDYLQHPDTTKYTNIKEAPANVQATNLVARMVADLITRHPLQNPDEEPDIDTRWRDASADWKFLWKVKNNFVGCESDGEKLTIVINYDPETKSIIERPQDYKNPISIMYIPNLRPAFTIGTWNQEFTTEDLPFVEETLAEFYSQVTGGEQQEQADI